MEGRSWSVDPLQVTMKNCLDTTNVCVCAGQLPHSHIAAVGGPGKRFSCAYFVFISLFHERADKRATKTESRTRGRQVGVGVPE